VSHPHATIIASPSVPERIRRELQFTRRHFQMKERCLFCDIINEETRANNPNSGLVRPYNDFVTLSPFFASHPFETWILPRKHNANFRNVSRSLFPELARVLQENLRVIQQVLGPISYTLLLFTRPNKVWGEERAFWTTIDDDYHWHFKFIPRFPRQSGFHRSFMAGSGYMINQVAPELGAEILRSHL
jgi:UDPglucose--hexose-1-phosphate uridylyltransferase